MGYFLYRHDLIWYLYGHLHQQQAFTSLCYSPACHLEYTDRLCNFPLMLIFFLLLFILWVSFTSSLKILLLNSNMILTSSWLVILIIDILCGIAVRTMILVGSYMIITNDNFSLISPSSVTYHNPYTSVLLIFNWTKILHLYLPLIFCTF